MGRPNGVQGVWDDLLTVPYMSAQPATKYGWTGPRTKRQDNDMKFNQQPWYHGSNFGAADPSQALIPQQPRRKAA